MITNITSFLIAVLTALPASGGGQVAEEQPSKRPGIEFIKDEAAKKVDVLAGGKLITSYCWPKNVYKPVLYPVYTIQGTEITRGFPLKPRSGERNDHIHQVGIWLNYGNVNGYDFWGNGSTGEKSPNGGEIKHLGIRKIENGPGEGLLAVSASWRDPGGKELLSEKTDFHFIVKDQIIIIDRITSLTATGGPVSMKDTKEGILGKSAWRERFYTGKGNS